MPWQPMHIDVDAGAAPVFGADRCADAETAMTASRMPRAFVFVWIFILDGRERRRPRNSIRTDDARSKMRRARAGRRQASAQPLDHGRREATARLGRSELQLLVAVDDHSR